MKVLVSDPLAKEGLGILQKAEGLEVDVKTGLKPEELVACIGEYDGIIVRSETKVTKEVIEAGKKLQVIGRAGVGVDNIDVPAATKKGIIVMNAPGGNTVSTAEHTFAMILALARNIPQADKSMKSKEWERKKFMGVELCGKTLGVVGLGRIGSYVSGLGLAFNMKVLAYDPFISQEKAKRIGVELAELDELYRRSDYITLHVPKSDETKEMISKETIAKMKDGVRIINCARGGLVDEQALAEALKSGKVAGAALDVYEKEPPSMDNPLFELTNCVTVPHLGASTVDAQVNVGIEVAGQVVDVLTGGPIRNAINIQQVAPEVFQEIAPYLTLAEKIGALHTQLTVSGIEEVEIKISGEIASYEVTPFTVAVLKGMLATILKEQVVNYVNAPFMAKERGIKIVENKETKEEDFVNLITVTLKTDKKTSQIVGSIFQKNDARIVAIDGFRIDAIPQGDMLVISNVDKPGVIGKIGTLLSKNNINIAGLQMGRKAIGGKQMIVLNVDEPVSNAVLQEISSCEEILDVRLVKL
ncbi:MAG: phosphoglycerate dehydrogenase [Nitrospirota bacterium]